MNIIFFDC